MPPKQRKKVGLALGSGAARGLAHAGVLEVLERENIPVDIIAGTSAGALVGALYALHKDARQTQEAILKLTPIRSFIWSDIALPRTGLLRGKRVHHWLQTMLGDVQFTDLALPFACVATDINSGEEVIISKGSVVEAVRASISLPGIFSLAKWDGRLLIDGGLVDPVPVRVLRDMGADIAIAVNVVPDMKHRVHLIDCKPQKQLKEPNIFNVMMRTIHIAGYQAVRACLENADIVIEPDVVHVGFGDFGKAKDCIARGKAAAEAAIPEIKNILQKRG